MLTPLLFSRFCKWSFLWAVWLFCSLGAIDAWQWLGQGVTLVELPERTYAVTAFAWWTSDHDSQASHACNDVDVMTVL